MFLTSYAVFKCFSFWMFFLSTWIRICISNAVLDPNAIEYCTDRNPKQKHWTWTDTTVMVTDLKFLFVLSLLLTFIFWWTNAFHLYSISFISTLFTLKTPFLLCSVHFYMESVQILGFLCWVFCLAFWINYGFLCKRFYSSFDHNFYILQRFRFVSISNQFDIKSFIIEDFR